jgi:hypothetical protein
MIRFLSGIMGLIAAAALSIGVIYALFDINWLSAAHRAGLAQLLSLPLDAYKVGHLYLLITHVACLLVLGAGLVLGAKLLPEPLRYLASHAGKLRYLLYIFYPLSLASRSAGKGVGRMLKVRIPKPRIEASVEWVTSSPRPFQQETTEPEAPRGPISISLDPEKPTTTETKPAAQEDESPESSASGLVFSDPMAETSPPARPPRAFQPDAGIAVVIDQLQELGYDTRANLLINASDGGFSADIFDDKPEATVELVAVDEQSIHLIETLDLGGEEWTVETMAEMHNRPWTDAKWRCAKAEIACPVSNLTRTRERFSAALLARMGMDTDQVISLLMVRNGTFANLDALTSYANAEDIEILWFDNPETIEPALGAAEGKMPPVLLSIMTQTGRRAA